MKVLYSVFASNRCTVLKKERGYFCSNSSCYSVLHVKKIPYNRLSYFLFRNTLHISEAQFMAFHFNCPLQSSLLRVIDNDTMTEMPRALQRTIPCMYMPNRKGYTLQAEAWVTGGTVAGDEGEDKKWKLRVITSSKESPPVLEGWSTEEGKEIDETFSKQEIMDYCLPNREEVLFRSYCDTT